MILASQPGVSAQHEEAQALLGFIQRVEGALERLGVQVLLQA